MTVPSLQNFYEGQVATLSLHQSPFKKIWCCKMEKYAVGGQAVIEGVMMRSPHHWVVAARKPDGNITYKAKNVNPPKGIWKKPLFRGVFNLAQTFIIGLQTLNYSANVSIGEEEKGLSPIEIALSLISAFGLSVLLFMVAPYFSTRMLKSLVPNHFFFALIEGALRLSIFVGYIYFVSMFKDIRRVFMYHGAEHKLVNTLEADKELTIENAKGQSTIHPSCGTTFLFIVLILAIITFTFLPTDNFLLRLGGKLLVVPFLAGFSYELIRLARRKRDSKIIKFLIAPGLWLQKLTTKEPTDDQLEVAKFALEKVISLEQASN